jgi:hypothetical protein
VWRLRRFIGGYANVSVALTLYLKEDVPEFELGEEVLQAHAAVKKAITSATILALPGTIGIFVLEAKVFNADASAYQIEAQFLQEQRDKSFRPIGYWRRH